MRKGLGDILETVKSMSKISRISYTRIVRVVHTLKKYHTHQYTHIIQLHKNSLTSLVRLIYVDLRIALSDVAMNTTITRYNYTM